MLGISKPVHTEEQLKEFRKNSKEKYDLTQEQRKMENKLRKLKNERLIASAAGDELEAKRIQRKINEQQAAYREFSEENNLYYDRKRATVEGYRRISVAEPKETIAKSLNKPANNDIISTTNEGKAVEDVHYVGKINKEIFSCVTKDIITDDVIITDELIEHIKERHPNDFEKYNEYIRLAVEQPEYIIEANKEKSALILKSFIEDNNRFKTILRIVTSTDNENYKNSIITFMKINEKERKRLIKNKNTLQIGINLL